MFEPEIERWSRRRLGQLGLARGKQDRALSAIARALADEGPLTRSEARDRVEAAGVALNQQTGMHIALTSVVVGIACLGPDRDKTTCLVRREDWLGRLPRFDRAKALAETARVYVRAFAPATDRDFAYWSGLPLRDVRAGLGSISKEIEEVRRGGGDDAGAARGSPAPASLAGQLRMLGNFDTYLLGWKDRGFSVSNEHAAHIKEGGGGWIRPVIVRDGEVVGGWRSTHHNGRLTISLNLDAQMHGEIGDAIEAEVADLARFEGTEAVLA